MLKDRIIFVLMLWLVILMTSSFALKPDMCINQEIFLVDPVDVRSDEDFRVGILLENCGEKIPDDVIFKITRHSEDIYIKESLISEIGKMGYANSKRFIIYNMRTSPNIVSGDHFFETELKYGKNNNYVKKVDLFSIKVNNLKPEIFIMNVRTNPEILEFEDRFKLEFEVENSGKGSAKEVIVNIEDSRLIGVNKVYLGEIKTDSVKTVKFFFEDMDIGLYNSNVTVQYKLDGNQVLVSYPISFKIFKQNTPEITLSRVEPNVELLRKGENFILTIDVENSGKGIAKDVRLNLKTENFEGVKLKYLGQILPQENLPTRFILRANKQGNFKENLIITFKENGIIKEAVFPINVYVASPKIAFYHILFTLVLVLALFYFIIKKVKKLKDEKE